MDPGWAQAHPDPFLLTRPATHSSSSHRPPPLPLLLFHHHPLQIPGAPQWAAPPQSSTTRTPSAAARTAAASSKKPPTPATTSPPPTLTTSVSPPPPSSPSPPTSPSPSPTTPFPSSSTPLPKLPPFEASPPPQTPKPPPLPPPPSPKPPPPPPSYSPSSPTITKVPHKPSHKLPNLPSLSTYDSTPSQASSVWNWENYYPPSPPDSEFDQNSKSKEEIHHFEQSHRDFDAPHRSHRDFEAPHHLNHHLDDDNDENSEEETEREEVQCSEWDDDHYSTTSSNTEFGTGHDDADVESRSEIGSRSNFGSSVLHNETESKSHFRPKSDKSDEAGSSMSWNANTESISDMKMVVRHRDLAEIAAAIKEYFEKAASAGEPVSELLETGRAQLDRSFRQLKSKFN